MLVEIYEEANLNSDKTDLDFLLDYLIDLLNDKGINVKRYDKILEPEAFEKYSEYKLPVVVVDGDIMCAGSYDFTLLDRNLLNRNSNDPSACVKKTSSGCASCPNKGTCQKI